MAMGKGITVNIFRVRFPKIKEAKHSRIKQIEFVEDSLQKLCFIYDTTLLEFFETLFPTNFTWFNLDQLRRP